MGKGEGKGEAKGGFISQGFECAEDIAGCACFCVFILVCLPPILIITGIVYMVAATTDSRGDKMKHFNEVE